MSELDTAADKAKTKAEEQELAKELTLAFGGDVMLGRLVNEAIQAFGPGYPLGNVALLLRKAGLALVNLECVIAEKGEPWPIPKAFYFKASPEAVKVLTAAGIGYVSLANNHTLDFQEEALIETIKHLDNAGIKHAGAGKNLAEAEKAAILETKGIKVAVLSFADHPEEFAATTNSAGINYTTITTNGNRFERIRQLIAAAKKLADVVVFSIHWGPNMRQRPSEQFKKFAHAVIDAGADVFHGHSAHIFQGIEIYKGKMILYDCGDLVDDYYVGPEEKNDQQLLFLVSLAKAAKTAAVGIEKIELVPLHISHCQVNLAEGVVAEEICSRITLLSAEMGTEVEKGDGKIIIRIANTKQQII